MLKVLNDLAGKNGIETNNSIFVLISNFYVKKREDLLDGVGYPIEKYKKVITDDNTRALFVHGLRTHPTILKVNLEQYYESESQKKDAIYDKNTDDIVIELIEGETKIFDGKPKLRERIDALLTQIKSSKPMPVVSKPTPPPMPSATKQSIPLSVAIPVETSNRPNPPPMPKPVATTTKPVATSSQPPYGGEVIYVGISE